MSTLSSYLQLKDVRLDLKSSDRRDALEELLLPLRSDHRVQDWERLRSDILSNAPNDLLHEPPCLMMLHHGRTEGVSELVLAVGRNAAGIHALGAKDKIHLIFLAAIPEALNSEYLRILGAISRVCRDPLSLDMLLDTKDSGRFLTILEKGCQS